MGWFIMNQPMICATNLRKIGNFKLPNFLNKLECNILNHVKYLLNQHIFTTETCKKEIKSHKDMNLNMNALFQISSLVPHTSYMVHVQYLSFTHNL